MFFLSGYSNTTHLRLLADATVALSRVRNLGESQGKAGTKSNIYRALVSTAVLSYTLGLRHALDADHISVCRLQPRWQAHGFLIEESGNRSNDSSAHSIRSTSSHCWNFLLSWSFNVRLFPLSHAVRSFCKIDIAPDLIFFHKNCHYHFCGSRRHGICYQLQVRSIQ